MSGLVTPNGCDSEPIHIPGSIQPHGALLGLRESELEILIASDNSGQFGFQSPHGRKLAEFVTPETRSLIRSALEGDPRDANPLEVRILEGRAFHGILHRSEGILFLEIEPVAGDARRIRGGYRRLVRKLDSIRRAQNLQEICAVASREVHALTGYDRVMVYRFLSDGSGQVLSEERSDDAVESYMGLHFPASDIPAQARRLYVKNTIRIIVDSAYTPVGIQPSLHPGTQEPIDLSESTLRSVSPIHCEYLRNMDVRGSMSISLLDGDELWGLIACHHREPKLVPYGTRLLAEFLAHVLSARISELARVEFLSAKNAAYSTQAKLIDKMISSPRFQDGLVGEGSTILDVVHSDGAAIVFRDEVTRVGATPGVAEILELVRAFDATAPRDIVAVDRLADIHPPAERYGDVAAGAIAVPLSASGDTLLWFREEARRSVVWAGRKEESGLDDRGVLSPRKSFSAWSEEVRGRSRPWQAWEVEVASDFRTALAASVIHQAAELERLNSRLVEADNQKDRFLAAVSHELRNPLNAIVSWAQMARLGGDAESVKKAVEGIERNAEAQARLIDDLMDTARIERGKLQISMKPVRMAEVLEEAMEAIGPSARKKSIRIVTEVRGRDLLIVGDAGRLRQVCWNLLNNAVKYSETDSTVRVRLGERDSCIDLVVEDEGVGMEPGFLERAFDPFRQAEATHSRSGLGLGLSIARTIIELHWGTIRAESPGLGLGSTFTVSLPTLRDASTGQPISGKQRHTSTGGHIDRS